MNPHMHPVRELWALLNRGERRSFMRHQAMTFGMALSTLMGVAAIVPFFVVLADPHRIGRNALLYRIYVSLGFATPQSFLITLGIGCVTAVLLANAINCVGTLAMNRFAHRIGNRLSAALFEEYLSRNALFHGAINSATLVNNVVWETTRGITSILQGYFQLSTNLVACVLIMASVIVVNPFIALGTLAGLGASYATIYFLVRPRLLRNGVVESRHTEERTRVAGESFAAYKELSLMHAKADFRGRFERSSHSISRAALNTQSIGQMPRYLLECLVAGGLVATALLLAQQQGGGGPWLAQLTYLGFAAYRLIPALQQVFQSLVRIRADRVAFSRIADDLHQADQRRARSPSASRGPSWRGRPHQEVQLTNLTFRYCDDRPPAVRGITLRIGARTTVGLVGPSGSGKTTLAELILGLLVPCSGTIAVDQTLLDDGNRDDWQAAVAYVPQRVFIFDASLAENISMAFGAERVDVERLRTVVRLAQLDGLVGSLPDGLQEMLGEQGVRLSGGQRQRIGIARALYRDASVLILDEATNALDRLTEDEIMHTLEALRERCTIILIAHRLSAALKCDQVFEIQDGTLVAVTERARITQYA